jgi:hypothetical protein
VVPNDVDAPLVRLLKKTVAVVDPAPWLVQIRRVMRSPGLTAQALLERLVARRPIRVGG